MSLLRDTKRKWLRARISLRETMYNILKINRERLKLPFYKGAQTKIQKEEELNHELKILNKLADRQAKLVQMYDRRLRDPRRRVS